MTSKADYSKKQITDALIKLLQTKPIDLITITELVDQANVSRNAFYNNYKSIDDVLIAAYRQEHYIAFKHKYQQLDYFFDDAFINDNITFFDKNTKLLLALYKWNLINYVCMYNTKLTYLAVEKINHSFANNYPDYFITYIWTPVFNVCLQWILKNKPESPNELFILIKQLKTFDHS